MLTFQTLVCKNQPVAFHINILAIFIILHQSLSIFIYCINIFERSMADHTGLMPQEDEEETDGDGKEEEEGGEVDENGEEGEGKEQE